jgi:hypothetical protein
MAESAIRMKQSALLLKKQTSQQVVADMASGTSAVRFETFEIQPFVANQKRINENAPYMGAGKDIVLNGNSTFKAMVAMNAGGVGQVPVPGTAPAYDGLLRASAMQRTTSTAQTDTAQSGGSKSAMILPSTFSAVDDIYAGHFFVVEDTSAGGTVGAAETVRSQFTLKSAASSTDDAYNEYSATVFFKTGTLGNLGHTPKTVYLPTGGGMYSTTVAGMDLTVTDGGVTQRRKILTWEPIMTGDTVASYKVTVAIPFGFTPGNTDAFKISEERTILDYTGSSKVAIVDRNFKYAVPSGATYTISSVRVCTNYIGASRRAQFDVGFPVAPNGLTFTIPEYVRYDVRSTGFEWYTVDAFMALASGSGGVLHRVSQTVCDMVVSYKIADIPMIDFSGTALLESYENATMPTVEFSNDPAPLPVNAENTCVILSGKKVAASDITFNRGNTVVYRDRTCNAEIFVSGFAPTGSITFTAPDPDTKNYIDEVKTNATGNVIVSHGRLGNACVTGASNISLNSADYANSDDLADFTIGFSCNAQGAGNNNFFIIYQ